MLEFKKVNAYYGKKQVLFDISLKLEKSSINVCLGLNGSGKSTLFSLLFNQIKYNGNIFLFGKDVKEYSLKEKAKSIAFLPQNLSSSELTVLDLVHLGRTPYLSFNNKNSKQDEELILDAVYKTNMQNHLNTKISELSGGEKQRAYLAMVLAQNTEIYIFDEPLSFIDPSFSSVFLKVVKELKQKGKSIIIIMHDVNKALDIADKILFLNDGKNEFFGSKEELINAQVIEKGFNLTKYEITTLKNDEKQADYIYK